MPVGAIDPHCHATCPNGPTIHPILPSCSVQHMQWQLRLALRHEQAATAEECLSRSAMAQHFARMLVARLNAQYSEWAEIVGG